MESPAPVTAKPSATAYEIVSWVLLALGVVFILYHHLLSGLLSGLFVYALVHRIAGRLTYMKVAEHKAKGLAVLLISLALVGVSTGIVFLTIAFVRGHAGEMPDMIGRLGTIVEAFREYFTARGIGEWIPEAEKVHENTVHWLREHSDELKQMGGASGKMFLHSLIGIVLGAMLSFHSGQPGGPLAAAFFERMRRFSKAFQQVFFAQVKISAMNTAFTAIYLLLVLPLFHVHLPFRGTLIAVTFIAGLIPVVGNLVSNSVIVLISLGVSPAVAVGSLVFLVLIHKLEYFLNAKIVGSEIHAAAWEILLAMVAFEAAFGIPGVIIAPIFYAYAKAEMKDKGLI